MRMLSVLPSFVAFTWAFQPAVISSNSKWMSNALRNPRQRVQSKCQQLGSDVGPDRSERKTPNRWVSLSDDASRNEVEPTSLDKSTDPIKFPYSVSNFRKLRAMPNSFYVDKTFVIRKLEHLPDHIIIHRPSRWGKSMLMSMLWSYYDCLQAADFEHLFRGLDIGNEPTSLKNSYYVLNIDLSLDVDCSMTPSEIRVRLEKKMFYCVKKFAAYYSLPAPTELDATFGLGTIAKQVEQLGGQLMILIDEYDRFANKLMFENPEAYNRIVVGLRDPRSSPIRGLFEAIKEISQTHDVDCRSVVVGISPVALSDASGANIWMDVSSFEDIGDAFGFDEDDLRNAVMAGGLTVEQATPILELMAKYYQGYQFVGSSRSYYNPTLAVYFLFMYFSSKPFRQRIDDYVLLWKDGPSDFTQAEDDITDIMQDENLVSSESVFALLGRSAGVDNVFSKLLNKDNPVVLKSIPRIMQLSELLSNDGSQQFQEEQTAGFMYYHGIATISSSSLSSPYSLQVPNELIRGPFLDQLRNRLELFRSDIACFTNPTSDALQKLFQSIVNRHHTTKDNSFSEGALQSELESALQSIRRSTGGFRVVAERKLTDGYFDLFVMMDHGIGILLALKRVRPNAIDYSLYDPHKSCGLPWNTQIVKWKGEEFDAARRLLERLDPEQMRALRIVSKNPEWYMTADTVDQLESNAAEQSTPYLLNLRARFPQKKILAFTLIQVGWQILIKSVEKGT